MTRWEVFSDLTANVVKLIKHYSQKHFHVKQYINTDKQKLLGHPSTVNTGLFYHHATLILLFNIFLCPRDMHASFKFLFSLCWAQPLQFKQKYKSMHSITCFTTQFYFPKCSCKVHTFTSLTKCKKITSISPLPPIIANIGQ